MIVHVLNFYKNINMIFAKNYQILIWVDQNLCHLLIEHFNHHSKLIVCILLKLRFFSSSPSKKMYMGISLLPAQVRLILLQHLLASLPFLSFFPGLNSMGLSSFHCFSGLSYKYSFHPSMHLLAIGLN